ncbi:MAG TPA: hypothetical protein VGM87_19155 [Roseomonas sp.]|jgi:hypothetical protein
MIEQVRAALPRRPLHLKPYVAAWRGWLLMLLGLAAAGGIFAWIGIALLPGIVSDYGIRDTARPLVSARVEPGGRCRSHYGLLHDCTVTLSGRVDAKSPPVRLENSILFFDFHVGDWSVQAMGDPAQPKWLTTDIALDHIWNRVVTLVLFAGLGLLIPFGLVRFTIRQNRERARVAAISGQVLEPVALRVAGRDNTSTTVTDAEGHSYRWQLPGRTRLLVDPRQAGTVLGVRPAAGGEAYPIDEKLRVIDLTAQERAALKAAMQG